MAMLRQLPGGGAVALSDTFAAPAGDSGRVGFVLAPATDHRRWVLYDLSGGGVRVNAGRIPPAATVHYSDLISLGDDRYRLEKGGAIRITTTGGGVCSYCRDVIADGETGLECPDCGRLQHTPCAEEFGRCGRCLQEFGGGPRG